MKPAIPTSTTATRKPPQPGRASAPATGSTGLFKGELNDAAETFAAACARPSIEVDRLRGYDRALQDLAAALHTVHGGLTVRRNLLEESMPDESAGHEQFAQIVAMVQRIAGEAEALVSDQRRRNNADWERINAPRKNERGYDYGANQE
ncbi:hypothetical protein [Amycolatopsis thailandensis]|nr:hypothetical protein [Amycolatopsis thailandensis]